MGKFMLKEQDPISKQSDQPVFKCLIRSATGEDAERGEFSYAASGHINSYLHLGNQSGNN